MREAFFFATLFGLLPRRLASWDLASQPSGGAIPLLLQRKPRVFQRARQLA